MTSNKKRILLFDIDGTLLDPLGEGHTCMRQALMAVFGVSGPIETYDMAGKTDWRIVTDLMAMAGVDPEEIDAKRAAAFMAYARQIEQAAPTFQMHPLPGVLPLLDWLADDPGFLLGLVTGNVRTAVPHKLRAVGIDPAIFRFGAFGSEHVDRNVLPVLALSRLERLLDAPVVPETALVIGDTPHDIHCARHAGAKVLSVASGTYDRGSLAGYQPDYLLDDLSDMALVMEILNRY